MEKYKKIFLDTCVLSDIGRLRKEKRANIAYEFLVNKKYQIVMTPFILQELERCPDKEMVNNIYDFLELSFIGFAKGSELVFREEIETYKNHTNIDIIEFTVSMMQRDVNGDKMDFINFRNNLLNNKTFKKVTQRNEEIKKVFQKLKRPLNNIDDYFSLIIFKHIYDNKISSVDYNIFPAFTVWAYSLAHKVESKGLKKNLNEANDVAMSYIVPYVDIVVAEKRQINLYNELKNKKILKALDDVVLKKYSDVFVDGEFKIDNIEL